MEPFQSEIEDERKSRLNNFPRHTGVGSLAWWGSPAGLTMPGEDFAAAAIAKVFRHVHPRNEDTFDLVHVGEHVQVSITTYKDEVRLPSPRLRERELEWRRTHAETLRQFENEWVVLEGEEIIAHGSDAAKAIGEAKIKGIKTPYIFFVEQESNDFVRIGL